MEMTCLVVVPSYFHSFFFIFLFFFFMKVYANKQGIQDSIANGKYPNYKDTNKQNEKEANIKVKVGLP